MDLPVEQSSINSFKEFVSKRRYLVPLALVGAVLIAGAGTLSIIAYQHQMSLPVYLQSFSTPQISVEALASSHLKSVVLIDVRSPEEYQEDHIGNSELVPLVEIEGAAGIQQVQNILQRYEKVHQTKPTLILYCTIVLPNVKTENH